MATQQIKEYNSKPRPCLVRSSTKTYLVLETQKNKNSAKAHFRNQFFKTFSFNAVLWENIIWYQSLHVLCFERWNHLKQHVPKLYYHSLKALFQKKKKFFKHNQIEAKFKSLIYITLRLVKQKFHSTTPKELCGLAELCFHKPKYRNK